MSRVVLGIVGALGLSAVSHAADTSPKGSQAFAAVPVFSWTGFYVGVNAGGAWNRSNWVDHDDPTLMPAFDTNGRSFVGGGHVGYNYQFGQIVLGVEGDFQFLKLNGTGQCSNVAGTVCNTKQDSLGSIRGRVGYAGIDRTLLYFTGGAGFTRYKFEQSVPAGAGGWNSSSRMGLAVGGGVEYALTNDWIVGIQYSYYDFGTRTSGGGAGPVNIDVKESESTVTGRLSYRFGR
jgi:outer membrane immunogenic protein